MNLDELDHVLRAAVPGYGKDVNLRPPQLIETWALVAGCPEPRCILLDGNDVNVSCHGFFVEWQRWYDLREPDSLTRLAHDFGRTRVPRRACALNWLKCLLTVSPVGLRATWHDQDVYIYDAVDARFVRLDVRRGRVTVGGRPCGHVRDEGIIDRIRAVAQELLP